MTHYCNYRQDGHRENSSCKPRIFTLKVNFRH